MQSAAAAPALGGGCADVQRAQASPTLPWPRSGSQRQLSRPPTPDAAAAGFAPHASPTPSPAAAPAHASVRATQPAPPTDAAAAALPLSGTPAAAACVCAPDGQAALTAALQLARCVAGSPLLQAALVGLEAEAQHPAVAAGSAAPAGLEWSLAQVLALLARAGDAQGEHCCRRRRRRRRCVAAAAAAAAAAATAAAAVAAATCGAATSSPGRRPSTPPLPAPLPRSTARPAVSEGAALSALWVLDAADSCQRSPATAALALYTHPLHVVCPEAAAAVVADWAATFAALRARLVAAQAGLLARLAWRVRLDFQRGACLRCADRRLCAWAGAAFPKLPACLGKRRNPTAPPAPCRPRADVLPCHALLFGAPAGLPPALAGAQQPLAGGMRQLCANLRRLAREYQAATSAAGTPATAAAGAEAPDGAPAAKRPRTCRAALQPTNY